MKTNLPKFEGRPVQGATITLTGRAHERVGALALDEEVFLVIKGTVSKIAHQDGTGELADVFVRSHTIKASKVVLIERDAGAHILDEALMLADERFGIRNLFNDGGDGDGA